MKKTLTCQIFDFRMEPKLTLISSYEHLDHSFANRFVAVAFQSEEVLERRGPPVTYFGPPWIRPSVYLVKTTTLVSDHEYAIPNFIKIRQAVQEKKSKM